MMDEVMKDLLEALKCAKNSLVAFKFLPGDANRWEESDEANLAAVDRGIARAEAAMAAPQPDADGWIPWAGGACPVSPDTLVDVKVKPHHEVMYRRFARNLEWSHDDPWCNHIDFYRVVKAQT